VAVGAGSHLATTSRWRVTHVTLERIQFDMVPLNFAVRREQGEARRDNTADADAEAWMALAMAKIGEKMKQRIKV
jgi:hypothetical protein